MRPSLLLVLTAALPLAASAQIVVANHDVNLRADQSSHHPPIRTILQGDTLALISHDTTNGYLHVQTRSDHKKGWVYKTYVDVAPAPTPTPPSPTSPAPPSPTPPSPPSPIVVGAGVPGSAAETGCGDGSWHHVYNPHRLLVKNSCVTVTGVIVDATATQATHEPDGVRHEGDGDTHGWLKVDPQYAFLLNAGNISAEGGNLVFEITCHYAVTQADAVAACTGLMDHTVIPPVGTHVAIRGSYVQDTNHSKWMEIHPVTSIVVVP